MIPVCFLLLLTLSQWVCATRSRRFAGEGDVLLEEASAAGASTGERLAFSPKNAILPLLGAGARSGLPQSPMVGPALPTSSWGGTSFALQRSKPGGALGAYVRQGEMVGPRQTSVTVSDDGHSFDIVVPASWARKLIGRSLRSIGGGVFTGTYRARLAADASREVEFEKMETSKFPSHRACGISNLVGFSPGVVPVYECQVYKQTTFMLRQAMGGGTLADLLKRKKEQMEHDISPSDGAEGLTPFIMPLEESLPILVDVLRGVQSLASRGVVHGDLVEDRVFMHGGRAYIGGLESACMPGSTDLGCLAGERIGSAFRQAPEMIFGLPTGPSNNVWSVGLIFGAMLFGGSPADSVIMRELPNTFTLGLDWQMPGREKIRAAVRDHFSVQQLGDFGRVSQEYADVLELLVGMLEPAETRRWSVMGSLQQAERVAKARQIQISEPATPPSLPEPWFEEWH